MKLAPYPEYKDSDVPWLGKVPAHWDTLPLRWQLRIGSGDFLSGERMKRFRTDECPVPVIGGNGVMAYTSESNTENPTIVIGRVGALCGNVHLTHAPSWVTDNALRLGFVKRFQLPFLTEQLRVMNLNRLANVSAQPLVTGGMIKAQKAVCPPSSEQAQIARFLDWKTSQINEFIRNKRRLIELLKEQKQNIINQAVTRGLDPNVKLKPSGVEWIGDIPEHWAVRKLKNIAAMRSGDNLTSEQIVETGDFPVYGGNGFRGYYSKFNRDGKYLLVGRQGALCGNVHRVEGKFWATEHAVVTDVRQGVSTDWYYYMLTVMNLNQYSESAAQPGISVEKIQNLRTALPSLGEQEFIVSAINRETAIIDGMVIRAEREIELIREYRTRLISDVVTGQVDVRGIEVPEVAEDELLALEDDAAESDEVVDDEGEMDESD